MPTVIQLLVKEVSSRDAGKVMAACSDASIALREAAKLINVFSELETTTTLWLMYMDSVMLLNRYNHAGQAGL